MALVLAIVLEEEQGRFQVLVHPQLPAVVDPGDLDLLGAIVEDLPVRVQQDPAKLLEHLSLLERGPLVTYEAGTDIGRYPLLLELCSSFVPL